MRGGCLLFECSSLNPKLFPLDLRPMKKILPLFLLFPMLVVKAQKQDYQVAVAAFYNLENLFDTTDNPLINDEEFLLELYFQ